MVGLGLGGIGMSVPHNNFGPGRLKLLMGVAGVGEIFFRIIFVDAGVDG
jgi:hypothetical protein